MITTILLVIASLGCIGAAITHSVLGERLFVPQIQAQVTWPGSSRSGDFMRRVVRLAWHATSLMWAAFGVIFAAQLLSFGGTTTLYIVSAVAFGILFVMTGPMTSWRHLGWPVFALITASLIGAALTSA